MTMELEYNRDLYGVEHEAGPFEITPDLIQTFNRSIGETNAMFTDRPQPRRRDTPAFWPRPPWSPCWCGTWNFLILN